MSTEDARFHKKTKLEAKAGNLAPQAHAKRPAPFIGGRIDASPTFSIKSLYFPNQVSKKKRKCRQNERKTANKTHFTPTSNKFYFSKTRQKKKKAPLLLASQNAIFVSTFYESYNNSCKKSYVLWVNLWFFNLNLRRFFFRSYYLQQQYSKIAKNTA